MLDGADDFRSYNTRNGQRPACQVAGCFEPASVYVVIKETEITHSLYADQPQPIVEKSDSAGDINIFKLILYLCPRHDYDLKYLLKENELEIAKRRHLILKETSAS